MADLGTLSTVQANGGFAAISLNRAWSTAPLPQKALVVAGWWSLAGAAKVLLSKPEKKVSVFAGWWALTMAAALRKMPFGNQTFPDALPVARVTADYDPGASPYLSDTTGVITGFVKKNGVPQAAAKLFLMYRDSLIIVQVTLTSDTGAFAFKNLLKARGQYIVVSLDPGGEPSENAIIYDKVDPS
jgi:hypothetical protein